MTRLEHLIRAKTQYALHSPFLFEMYREVLFAPLDNTTRKQQRLRRREPYEALVYKCCHYYGLQAVGPLPSASALRTVRLCTPPEVCDPLTIVVVSRPHCSHKAEQEWNALQLLTDYPVSLDLYHVALLVRSPRLYPQHLLLR